MIFGGEDGTAPDVVSLPEGEAEGAKSDIDAPWQVADGLPQLVIFGGEDGTAPDVVSLPEGEAEGAKSDIDAWQVALRRAEEVFDSGGAASHTYSTVSTVAEDEVIDRTTNGTLAGALTDMVRRILN